MARKSTTDSGESVAYIYNATQNPDGAGLPGVPLRDLTVADLAQLPAWLVPSIAACAWYQATAAAPALPPPEKEDADGTGL